MLSERRRELGYSIGQASRVLRLREDVLVAFEEGNFDEMPKSGYAQGMLSSYARYLGLDAGVVIETYLDDLDAHKHRSGGRGKGSTGRNSDGGGSMDGGSRVPRVPSRGLLPTSGGYAGDLGSFATTRVHTRMSDTGDTGEAGEDGDAYPQGRRYTGKAPAYGSKGDRADRRGSASDINTLSLDYSQYDDDLLMGRDAMPYEAASSSQGRRRLPRDARAGRPQVNRRSSQQPAGRRRRADRGGAQGKRGRQQGGNPNRPLIIIGVVVLVFVVVMVLSIHSCVSQTANPTRSVPITTSQKSESGDAKSQGSGKAADDANGTKTKSEDSQSASTGKTGNANASGSGTTSADQGTTQASDVSVSVSVADGAVAWLEISCDGKSEVAETVTGPWQKSFHVQDAITIQSGDTSAVTVLQDGKQVQFESMASGIGTIRIQGPGKRVGSTKSTNANGTDEGSATAQDETDETGSAKMGNGSAASGQADTTGLSTEDATQYVDDSTYAGYYGDYTESGY
ncbi:MAG: helix-turn-helix transcriptional regulator [Coriobacteriales bacterium]|nr:helix-turn-helix transcriptional regulator [Coriobacteriales bacterium]